MFRLFQILVFIFFSSVLCAADFEKTYEAYQKGDYETALNGFFELASENHMKAQFYLGVMYREGKGVKQDYSKSFLSLAISVKLRRPRSFSSRARGGLGKIERTRSFDLS